MTLTELQTAHPYGLYLKQYGCYYTVDYDNEMGYFRQLIDGSFEKDWNFVDFDTLGENMREELLLVAKYIHFNM